ncbi:MAG TPA: glutaredoxin family protein [Noviherbaspirillum sp.]
MKRVLQSCSLLLLLCAASAHAQLYKWVGPDGKVTYSDTPPPKTAKQVETKSLTTGSVNTADFPFELAEAVRNSPVTLYTTRDCAPCEEARQFLNGRGIPYKEKTVNTPEDINQFRQVSTEGQLPLLTVGRAKESGYEPGAWRNALTNAGYPESSKLPRSYRNPPAEAAAPAPKPAAQETDTAKTGNAAGSPQVTDVPPPTGNAPPGFRF